MSIQPPSASPRSVRFADKPEIIEIERPASSPKISDLLEQLYDFEVSPPESAQKPRKFSNKLDCTTSNKIKNLKK